MLPVTTIVGRLSADPTTRSGVSAHGSWFVSNFFVLTDEYRKSGNITHSYRCRWGGARAQEAISSLKKGDLVQVTCTIKNESYVGKDGKKVFGFIFEVQDYTKLSNNTRSHVQPNEFEPPEEAYVTSAPAYIQQETATGDMVDNADEAF